MRLINKICVENEYSGSNWDFEKTTKYVFDLDGWEIEAGYFEHYKDGRLVKSVLELPQSYGCPSKCGFCATSGIEQFYIFRADQLLELFDYLYTENSLIDHKYVLLTMTGMGDIYYNYDHVERFLLGLKGYTNLSVTLSSVLWNAELLRKVELLSSQIRIRNVQITYVTDNDEIRSKIIPIYRQKEYKLDEVIAFMKESHKDYYRLNYILMEGINDNQKDFEIFANKMRDLKDKVIIRISKLNETKASKRNRLYPAEMEVMEKFHRFLQDAGMNSYVFYAKKNDHMNCGQLITENKEE